MADNDNYAKQYSNGYELAGRLEDHRREKRKETFRGAYADLCHRLNQNNGEIEMNPGYWVKRWEGWHRQEIMRFFDELIEHCGFQKKRDGRGHRIIAPKSECDHFCDQNVTNFLTKKRNGSKGKQAECDLVCDKNVTTFVTNQKKERKEITTFACAEESAPPTPASKRGSRLPADWSLCKILMAWTKKHQPDWDDDYISRTLDSFKDFWAAAAGQKGVKLDWDATWRTWVRNETKFNGNFKGATNAAKPTTKFAGHEF